MLHELRHLGARVGPWPRRVVALACLLLAAVSAADAQGGAAHGRLATVRIVAATRLLPVGHVLVPRDVGLVAWPSAAVPAGALTTPATAIGRRLAAPMSRGEPLSAHRLMGRGLADGLDPGVLATEVALADPRAADLVHPGDRVDVLAVPAGASDDPAPGAPAARAAPAVVAEGVRVLAVMPADPAGSTDDATAELVIAAPRVTAVRLAGDGSSQVFAVLLRSP